jgi:hypothetical protein
MEISPNGSRPAATAPAEYFTGSVIGGRQECRLAGESEREPIPEMSEAGPSAAKPVLAG